MSTVYHHVNVRIVFCFFKTKLFCEVSFENTSQFARIAHVLPMVLMVRCVQVSHLVMPQELPLPERNPKAKQGTQRKDGACLGAPTMLRNPHCWPLLHGSWHSNAQPFAEMKRWMQRCNWKISKKYEVLSQSKKDLSKVKSGDQNWWNLLQIAETETSVKSVEIPAFKPVLWSFSASWSTAMLEGAQTKTCWNGRGRLSDTGFFRPLRQYKRYKRRTTKHQWNHLKKKMSNHKSTTSLNWIEQKHVYIPGLTLILPSEVENNGGTGHGLSSSWKLSL